MAKSEERLEARALRRKGWSVGAIAKELGVSKSSASSWCVDIVLTREQRKQLIENSKAGSLKGRFIGVAMNRKKKMVAISVARERGKKEIKRLSQYERMLVGLGLYWGEGVKADKSQLAIVNSDPRLIYFMYKWFRKVFGVKKSEFRPRVFINAIHRPREQKILKFWSALLNIPPGQFGGMIFLNVKNKKVYENYDSYYGVLALRVRKSISLKYRILGLIEALGGGRIMPG